MAFGPPDQSYHVLQGMAEKLPRGSFQKLGLSADKMRTAFSSLTSDLTTLRTVGGSSAGLTLRQLKPRLTSDTARSVQVSPLVKRPCEAMGAHAAPAQAAVNQRHGALRTG